MGRKKKSIAWTEVLNDKTVIEQPVIEQPVIEQPVIEQSVIEQSVLPVISGITLNEYLTNHSQDRSLDGVFQNWFMRQDKSNPRKQVDEWDELIQKFLNETV